VKPVSDFAADGARQAVGPDGAPYRFPIITTFNPRWYYVDAVMVGHGGAEPTPEELAVLAERHENLMQTRYRGEWLRAMRERLPFDVDPGFNTAIFMKRESNGSWSFCRTSWQDAGFVPAFNEPPLSLAACIARERG
jgi:hypothetical protein